MHPQVTAVITTHGRPIAVCAALASVRADLHKDMEVIVVDDGGSFVAQDGGDLRVLHGSDLGVARARNLGLAHARGEFVIYLDDDDVALPNRISSLLSAALQQDASLCFGMTRRVVEGTATMLESVPTRRASGRAEFKDVLTCNPHVNAVLARTERLRAFGGFDASADHFDDWAAWLRIADRDEILWQVADTVAEWRIHPLGLSGKVLHGGVMKARILALFDHLSDALSADNAQTLAAAKRIVESSDIRTYDDYVDVIVSHPEFMPAQTTAPSADSASPSMHTRFPDR